jgi:hypothetical protein
MNSSFSEDSADWNKKFNDLCSYDLAFCHSLKSSDGKWKQPKKEMVMALKELSPSIDKAAKDFGVDPRAIAGSILAENSLNVSISDDIQDWLVKMKIAGDGDLLGKQFSFGWGQLYMDAAMEAEPTMAKVEGRKKRTAEEVAAALLKPEESIRYVAAVIKTIQENYKKEGFDISDKPEILTTLYNLGGSRKRAIQARKLEREPRVNYFGFFVDKNISVLDAIVNPEVNEKNLANQEFWDISKPKGRVDNFLSYFKEEDTRPKELARRATEEIILVHSPPQCDLGDNHGDREYIQNATFSQSKPSGSIQFKEGFREVSTYLDCDLDEWKLVEGEDGTKKGWVSLSQIKENSRPSKILKLCEKSSQVNKCINNLKQISTLEVIPSDGGAKGKLLVSLSGKKKKINWKRPYIAKWCNQKSEESNSQLSKATPLDEEDLKKLNDGIKKFKNNVGKIVDDSYIEENGDYCFNCNNNPYHFLGGSLNLWSLESCTTKPQPSQGKYSCTGDVDKFLIALNKLKIKKKPKWTEIKSLLKDVSDVNGHVKQNYNDDNNSNRDISEILEVIKEELTTCLHMIEDYPKSKKLINETIKSLKDPATQMQYANNRGVFSSLKSQCESLEKIYKPSENSKTKSDDCVHCSANINIYMPVSGSQYSNQQNLSIKIIDSMLKTKDEKDVFFVDQVEAHFMDLGNNSNYGNLQYSMLEEDVCSYDPKETAKLINQVLELKCVKNVYVPDPWLINYFTRKKESKVPFLKGFIENDRFEIDITERNLCTN